MPTAVITVLCILAGVSIYILVEDNSSRLGGLRSGFLDGVEDFKGAHMRPRSENAALGSSLSKLERWSKVATLNKTEDASDFEDLDTTTPGNLCEAISRLEEPELHAVAELLKESAMKREKSQSVFAQNLSTGPERDSLPRSDTSSTSPPIGNRVWPKLTQEEIRSVREGSKEWDLMSSVLNLWNAGWKLDEARFYHDRPETLTEVGGGQPGFALLQHVLNPEDPRPVEFVPRGDPPRILLPKCERNFPTWARGAVSFAWKLMHSDAVTLPDPAFSTLDVRFRCRDRPEEELILKTFAKAAAHEYIDHPHFQKLKSGYRQYVASGAVVDPPGPFASYSPLPSPAWLNHFRRASLFEWVQKSKKRDARRSDVAGGAESGWEKNEYDIWHLRNTFETCFPVSADASAVLNILARQGCL
ncbi:hypothetical protein KFL_000530150 [Klebsormidium nitens]|uniref:Uncharacterized protein n=1 Tax=Klebsormidium nitens TaxID=105231 RepID=A0A1Y1HV23_KLENI|nr:hypothetical protein KFL_000530150 [Klebsormidium nitens]|eukprot:GAQ80387.1 hypothetical protein KFL_000530150 [Klebsormidium nitens]